MSISLSTRDAESARGLVAGESPRGSSLAGHLSIYLSRQQTRSSSASRFLPQALQQYDQRLRETYLQKFRERQFASEDGTGRREGDFSLHISLESIHTSIEHWLCAQVGIGTNHAEGSANS